MDWITASGKLTGRCRESRKIGNHTYLKRRHIPGSIEHAFAVKLHDTDILTFYPDGKIELHNGGFPTCTTHARMNEFLPSGYRVYGEPVETQRSDSGMSVLVSYVNGRENISEVTCDTHATILPDGTIDGGDIAEYRETRKREQNERNRPRNRARYWVNKVREGKPYKGTVESIMQEENVTVRVAKMRCYGIERYFLDAKATVIDEKAGYQLLELPLDTWRKMRALKMACTTTNAVYVNAVPEHVHTVAEGLDWMFNTTDYLGTVSQQA